jgi:hypothetical protein
MSTEVSTGAAPTQAMPTPASVTTNPGTGTPSQTMTSSQNATSDWTGTLNEDLKGYVQNKGFKDPTAVVDSYRNLEKLMGAPKERLLKLPEKDDDVEGWNQVFDKLGVPPTPKDYKFDIPKETGDPALADWAKSVFHELKVPGKQATKIIEKWNARIAEQVNAQKQQFIEQANQQEAGLKKEWGAAYDQNINVARKGAQVFGITSEKLDKIEQALGYAETMRLMYDFGAKVGETSFVSGGQSSFNGALTPQAAKAQINDLKMDSEFIKRFASGDAQAKAEWERLHRFAFPG